MHRGRSISWLIALAVCLATPASALSAGENFVAPYKPDPEAWVLERDPNRPTTRLWKNKQNERDLYRIEVFPGSPDEVAEVRMSLDGPGKANCPSFDTTTIRQNRINGYPRLLWRTDCGRGDGAKSTLLNLAVRGRDGVYLAMKIWQFEVADAEVDVWIERFERYLVCDTRRPEQRCPDGFEPVE